MNRRYDSDLDAADAVAGIPEDELMARQAEIDREARWAAFVAECRQWHCDMGYDWSCVVVDAGLAINTAEAYGPDRFAWHCQQFAETEGWPAVFNALARAMRDEEQERERLLTQG